MAKPGQYKACVECMEESKEIDVNWMKIVADLQEQLDKAHRDILILKAKAEKQEQQHVAFCEKSNKILARANEILKTTKE